MHGTSTRSGRKVAIALIAVACTTCGSPEPKNVVLYVVDTLRADALGAYGATHASTPHFDRFASEGVLFEHAFAPSAWTRPSVASILTGLHPTRHRAEGRNDALPAGVQTLAERLRERGYRTGFITTNPNVGTAFGFTNGVDDMLELYEQRGVERGRGMVGSRELITPSDVVTQQALEWIASAPRPFFLVAHTIDPHAPYDPPEGFGRLPDSVDGLADGSLRGLRDIRSPADREYVRLLYDGEVSFNDESFGALLTGLETTGLIESTIVVFVSDHGEEFWEYGTRRDHGRSLVEEVIQVPLAIRHPDPARIGAGRRVANAVELVDIVPTLLDLLDSEVPEGLDGRALFADAPPAERPAFASLQIDGHQLWSARQYPWKLVRDHLKGTDSLYDLRKRSPESSMLRVRPGSAEAETRGRLARFLDDVARRAATDATRARATAGELSPESQEALRALGYAE